MSVSMSSSGQYAVASYWSGSVGGIYWSNDYGKTWTDSTVITTYQWQNASISGNGQHALGCVNYFGGEIYYCKATN